jgi:hypothetical protein
MNDMVDVSVRFKCVRTGDTMQSIHMVTEGDPDGEKELLAFQAVYPLDTETMKRVEDLAMVLMGAALLVQVAN